MKQVTVFDLGGHAGREEGGGRDPVRWLWKQVTASPQRCRFALQGYLAHKKQPSPPQTTVGPGSDLGGDAGREEGGGRDPIRDQRLPRPLALPPNVAL